MSIQEPMCELVEIVEGTLRYREDLAYYEADQFTTIGPTRYHDQFLLVTGGENADGLVLDMLPEPGGVMGQVVIFSTQPTQLVVIARDWATFLRSLVADYRQGRFRNQPCNYFVSYGDFSCR